MTTYDVSKLSVGESTKFICSGSEEYIRLNNAIRTYGRKKNRKYTVRTIEEGVVQVWRISTNGNPHRINDIPKPRKDKDVKNPSKTINKQRDALLIMSSIISNQDAVKEARKANKDASSKKAVAIEACAYVDALYEIINQDR